VDALGQGIELEKQGKYQEAVEAFQQATQADPTSSVAWAHLGAMLQAAGRSEESLAAFDQALRLDPRNASAWEGKARALMLQKAYREAIGCCEKALAVSPSLPEALYVKGRSLASLDDKRSLKDAVKTLDRALSLNPNHVEALAYKAFALSMLGKYDEAIPPGLKAVSLNSNYDMVWRILATAYWYRRDFGRALHAVDQALRLDPQNQGAWILKGGILRNAFAFSRDISQLNDALAAFDQALALDPSDWAAQQGRNEAFGVLKQVRR
jgi:tetratricopeptide (TPR) repeat protein